MLSVNGPFWGEFFFRANSVLRKQSQLEVCNSSFPVIHKVVNVVNFVLLRSEDLQVLIKGSLTSPLFVHQ